MTEDPNDKVGKPVKGIVTHYWPSEGENDPHALYVKGYDEKFSTFDDETAAPIQTGTEVHFRAEKNGEHWNIKDGTVSVLDDDPGPVREQRGTDGSIKSSECSGEDAMRMFSMDDARIMSQSITRSAVMFHQYRAESTVADVEETAEQFAELQADLFKQLRGAVMEAEA
jgi:hypothetical protein